MPHTFHWQWCVCVCVCVIISLIVYLFYSVNSFIANVICYITIPSLNKVLNLVSCISDTVYCCNYTRFTEVRVDDVEPKTGSAGGGTVLTLTGQSKYKSL